MTQRNALHWCPQCGQRTPNAPLPQLARDEEMIALLGLPGDPQGFFRRHYCLECRAIWRSVQVPLEFVEELLACRQEADDLRRQLAMLRFLLANERQQQALEVKLAA